jgi:hypothetical protein
MQQVRFRLRTLMITIAFIALLLALFTQTVLLRRAQVREELYRALAAESRAKAAQELARVEQQLAKAEHDQRKFDEERRLRQEALKRFNERMEQKKLESE